MDANEIRGKWKQIEGAIVRKWGKLTQNDLTVAAGSIEKLAGKIQEKYGLAKDKVKTELDALLNDIVRKPVARQAVRASLVEPARFPADASFRRPPRTGRSGSWVRPNTPVGTFDTGCVSR